MSEKEQETERKYLERGNPERLRPERVNPDRIKPESVKPERKQLERKQPERANPDRMNLDKMNSKRMKPKRRPAAVFGRFCLILCCLAAVVLMAYAAVKYRGKIRLRQHAETVVNTELSKQLGDNRNETVNRIENQEEQETKVLELKEGQILSDGKVYQYNEEILTFLCMGVDAGKGIAGKKTPGNAGQADAILLVVVNPRNESIEVIPINRDTMMDIEIYDTAGVFVGEEQGQIALQYAYGDGRERSCELMEQKVSHLMFGIPVHGYGVLDMDSIRDLNDAVGGVEVVIPEDMTMYHRGWKKGERILLKGTDALTYIRERDEFSGELGTNISRIERQKQYMDQYVKKLKEEIRRDLTFPITLFQKVQDHMLTSLTVDQITYLASTLTGYEFSMEHMITIPGSSAMGEKHEEFYVDDQALKQIVIDVFYEVVPEEMP